MSLVRITHYSSKDGRILHTREENFEYVFRIYGVDVRGIEPVVVFEYEDGSKTRLEKIS